MTEPPSEAALRALDATLDRAFTSGDDSALHVLGYGEISAVLRCADAGERWACRRLPPLRSRDQVDAYRELLADYLRQLRDGGLRVLPTTARALRRDDGSWVVYCVQPELPAGTLATRRLGSAGAEAGRQLLAAVVERVFGVIRPRLGLDAQLANWLVLDDEPTYLDVSTPLVRDARGNERLDTELFLASLPAALRPLVRRLSLGAILDKYYSPRGAALDLLGNLYKEGLPAWVETGLDVVNARLDAPLSRAEVRRYYASDARLWEWLQRLRRADRFWRRRVRRRPYPFLLPGPIERRR